MTTPSRPAITVPYITLTGIDEHTDDFSALGLGAEIGILYTATPEGRNRYPSRNWIASTVILLPRVALHVCGSLAREQLKQWELGEITKYVQRIQVNGTLTRDEVEVICASYPLHQIITQHTNRNIHLLEVAAPNHAILIDGSGGRGISPEAWPSLNTSKPVGFAGGLGPDNLHEELARISKVASGQWWVDMEGKLRVDDWFSIERAKAVVDCFTTFLATWPNDSQPAPRKEGETECTNTTTNVKTNIEPITSAATQGADSLVAAGGSRKHLLVYHPCEDWGIVVRQRIDSASELALTKEELLLAALQREVERLRTPDPAPAVARDEALVAEYQRGYADAMQEVRKAPPAPEERETPEVDAILNDSGLDGHKQFNVVPADFARSLERRLIQSKSENARLRAELDRYKKNERHD